MNISEFISNFRNHPILFIGTGLSLRYLEESYTWDELLKKIAFDLKGNNEYYLDIKSRCYIDGKYKYEKIATIIENEFNNILQADRNGKFKEVNDIFYQNMQKDINLSRFKIYISELFKNINVRADKQDELSELKKVRKNIGSIITTNYDKMIENIFEFNSLVGNSILLSNPYGALYKIHGCVEQPDKIIISEADYNNFEQKFELIRAQLLSLFIHNPIIFLGYNIGDENIKKLLKTIFTYVEPNSDVANRIRSNFLLIEYEQNSDNINVNEHDIDMEGFSTIRINKIKTDNFIEIYHALAMLQLPVSAMDIRKVQNIVGEIYSGGDIKVSITEDLEGMKNSDKVLVIGTKKTITYTYQTASELMINYFKIIEESNFQILDLIDKFRIPAQQFFPIYAFTKINSNINDSQRLKNQQKDKLNNIINKMHENCKVNKQTISEILDDTNIGITNKTNIILFSILNSYIDLSEVETYLINYLDKKCTDYRRILCAYDYIKYKDADDYLLG